MEKIKIFGLDDFDEIEKVTIRRIAEDHYDKIEREADNFLLILHPKKYEQDGKRNKYSIHVKAEANGVILFSAEAAEWEIEKATHMALDKLKNGIEHKFKTQGK